MLTRKHDLKNENGNRKHWTIKGKFWLYWYINLFILGWTTTTEIMQDGSTWTGKIRQKMKSNEIRCSHIKIEVPTRVLVITCSTLSTMMTTKANCKKVLMAKNKTGQPLECQTSWWTLKAITTLSLLIIPKKRIFQEQFIWERMAEFKEQEELSGI